MKLEQAKLLCEAIHSRLAKLREAKNTARDQLRVVEEDIAAHRQVLNQAEVDKDVSEVPADLLQTASGLLEQAKPKLNAAQPDWLGILTFSYSEPTRFAMRRSPQRAANKRRCGTAVYA